MKQPEEGGNSLHLRIETTTSKTTWLKQKGNSIHKFLHQTGRQPTISPCRYQYNTIRHFVKEKLLPEHIAKAVMVDNPKTARFYLSPKVHKINNPGRPITNAINSPTSSIAEFVDYQLQPMVQNLKSYTKDTADFPARFEKNCLKEPY